LEKEKNQKDIFQLAAGGFTSTVRLAKSAPHTWVPIFLQNRHHLLEVLQSHIEQLRAFELALSNNSASSLQDLIERANHIKKII
jgi:prephenate dehydrogenase